MNYLPAAGPLAITPFDQYHEERPVLHEQALRVPNVHFDRVTASDGIDKHVQLHLWFEQLSGLPDSIVDQLEAHCLSSDRFALTLPRGTLLGRLADIQIMTTTRQIEIVRLSFTLFVHPPVSQGPVQRIVQWLKKFLSPS